MTETTEYKVCYVPAPTESEVWDDVDTEKVVRAFMPPERKHPPMVGIIDFKAVRPTRSVLRQVVASLAEDVKAGRYGDCSLVYYSEDEDTRYEIEDIAESQNTVMFICATLKDLQYAEPVGDSTNTDRATLELVLEAGGTVSASSLALRAGIDQSTAGNRLVSLQKKGYVLRAERPHPAGDLFIDPRSLAWVSYEAKSRQPDRHKSPNRITQEAIEAARRGDLIDIGNAEEVIAELNRDDG